MFAKWAQHRVAVETAYVALTARLVGELAIRNEVWLDIRDKDQPTSVHRHTDIRFAEWNLIDETVGLLPIPRDPLDFAPYHSIFEWMDDERKLSDICYTIDYRTRELLFRHDVKKVADIFEYKQMV